jgi:hypothetical protein
VQFEWYKFESVAVAVADVAVAGTPEMLFRFFPHFFTADKL